MSDASWQVCGTAECPTAAREAELAVQLEVQFELEEYLRGARGRRQLAFARWCRQQGR